MIKNLKEYNDICNNHLRDHQYCSGCKLADMCHKMDNVPGDIRARGRELGFYVSLYKAGRR